VRQEEAVADVFAALYGDNDLLVSFDGVCFMPPEDRNSGRTWLHVDQSHRRRGLCCIQGYVNLTPAEDERTGSLAVVPGSHLKHGEFGVAHPRALENGKDWFKFDGEAERASLGDEPVTRVHGGVGSLVLWDSRTAHQAMEPPKSVAAARERCVVYVCYQPRAWCSEANLRKKSAAFDAYRMTTHWPASKIELFPLTWRTWGKPVPPQQRAPPRDRQETPRMLELAGKTPLTTRARHRTPQLL
jgi:hypothetical protein